MSSTIINTRLGTASNLEQGGTYDLLLVKIEGEFPEGKVNFGLYDVPMKITGLQKVAQFFLKTLLTGKGSDPFYPEKGTYFSRLTINANIQEDDPGFLADLRETVNDAAEQTKIMLNVNTVDRTSALDKVVLLGLDRVDEGVILYIQITTLAGEMASVAMPFPEFGLSSTNS